MSTDDDALAFVARMHEESTRQLAQLRVTLDERIQSWRVMREEALRCGANDAARKAAGRLDAYGDVLTLLGPEPAWTDDGESPF